MHPHSHPPFAYYGEQTDQGYPPNSRSQEPTYWSQDMYTSPPAPRPHHPPPPTNSWPAGNPSVYSSQYPSAHAQWDAPGVTPQGMPYSSPPSHAYHSSTSSAPPPDSTRWQSPEPAAVHMYERLPSANKDVVDAWLEKDSEKRVYRCRGSECGKEFSSKDNARVHVHGKHLGQNKLFRCVQCRTEFASEDGAKRHRDTATSKTFSCSYCSNTYARKDYRDLHQKKCTSRRNY